MVFFLRFEEFSGKEGGIVRFCGGSGLERKENGKNAISYAVDACVDLKNITIQWYRYQYSVIFRFLSIAPDGGVF